MNNRCIVCESKGVVPLLDFGRQVLCNRYLLSPQQSEALFPFALGNCGACGLIQYLDPIAPAELKAPFDWVSYNEQEGHLDDLVEKIFRLRNVSSSSSVGAISYKDDTTIARLQKRGCSTWRIDLEQDLGINDRLAGLETIQDVLTPQNAEAIAVRRGRVDVLIVRHILEHSHRPKTFAEALKRLCKPGAYLVFEIPDCEPALNRKDYSMPWEEHVAYYTPHTFRHTLQLLGFSVIGYERYLYSNENSLVAIVQASSNKSVNGLEPLRSQLELGDAYAEQFVEYKTAVRSALENYREKSGKIAVFGAGHLSCFWINALNVADLIDFVVDDHPKKKGMFMPGSRLEIRGSSCLISQSVKLCLLSLSPESEAKVVQKNAAFTEQGGRFLTIFPGKANSLA